MRVNLILFAGLREKAGASSISLDLPDLATAADLKAAVAKAYPDLKTSLASLRIAINATYADDADPIPPDAELAAIPPVSGGSLRPELAHDSDHR